MFIYEDDNSLKITFKGFIPVEKPEVVLAGFQNGVKVIVNDVDVISLTDPIPFETKAKTLVYQKDGKMFITFNGIEGMANPEVVIDEVAKDTYTVTCGESSATLVFSADSVTVSDDVATETETPEVSQEEEPEIIEPQMDEEEIIPETEE